MSGIAGYCEFERTAISPEIMAILGDGIAQCGDDGSAQLERGPAVLLQRAFHTGRSPEPPQHYDADGLSIVWDGRIDNRDELAARTGGAARADAELIAALYRRDPDGPFVAPVVGDFSFALWDAPRRTLILGRDAFGIRLLFYHASPHRVVWATKIDPLLDPLLGIDPAIDDEYLGAYVLHVAGAEETPYRAIRAVPPGAMVVVTPEGTTVRRFWSLHSLPDVTLRSDSEYEERLLELLRESVAARLQTDRPVAAELSGGLDSSTIVCLASALLRDRAVAAPGLVTISYVFDEAKIADERRYIAEVEQAIGQRGVHLREEDHRLLSTLADGESPLYPTPEICLHGAAPRSRPDDGGRRCAHSAARGRRRPGAVGRGRRDLRAVGPLRGTTLRRHAPQSAGVGSGAPHVLFRAVAPVGTAPAAGASGRPRGPRAQRAMVAFPRVRGTHASPRADACEA